jgi:hypothetical protein
MLTYFGGMPVRIAIAHVNQQITAMFHDWNLALKVLNNMAIEADSLGPRLCGSIGCPN